MLPTASRQMQVPGHSQCGEFDPSEEFARTPPSSDLRIRSHTGNRVLVLFYFEVRKGGCPDMIRTSKSEHDASMTAGHAPENGLQRGHEHVFWSRSAAYTGVFALYAITLASQPRLARFAGPRHRDASSALERWTSRQQTALCAAYHRHRTTEVRHLCLPFIDQISS